LTTLVEKRRDGQIIVGFAAESDHVLENGLSKIRTKQCDLLVVNDVSKEGVGFDHATNEVFLIDRDEDIETISLRSKEAVSYEILSRVAALLTQGAQ
jgi:phosphopantothenoylcysteine decarboxylase/phosphopantothenate--cysteine ligase